MTKKTRERKVLKNKMATALSAEISKLSIEMRDVLVDDLVTAFESRLSALTQARSNVHFLVDSCVVVQNETAKA